MTGIHGVIEDFGCAIESAPREIEAIETIVELFEVRLDLIYLCGEENYWCEQS
jgi:hypothetical protein